VSVKILRPLGVLRLALHGFWISQNPKAIGILESHPELVSETFVLRNPNVLKLLEMQMDKITDFYHLSHNPNGIELIQKMLVRGLIPQEELEFIVNGLLLTNSSIYDLDYEEMSKVRSKLLF
jgi:hypothetical protein